MNIKYPFFQVLFCFVLLIGITVTRGQGCSDAGACSIGSVDVMTDSTDMARQRRLNLSFEQNVGLGEKFIFISQSSLIVEHQPWRNFSYVVRVPYIITSGNLGNSQGVGDVIISLTYRAFKNEDHAFSLLAGTRLRSNHADFSFAGNPLPMAYQTSLGTNDVIAGMQFGLRSWDFYLAYQHPFGRNENEYLNDPSETDKSKVYFESARLKRGDDLAVRIQKGFALVGHRSIQAGVLGIYRLWQSEIIRDDQPVRLDNSEGLTLNLFVTYSGKFNEKTFFQLTGAFPVVDRDYRADGLTRNFVLNFSVTGIW